MRCRFGPFEHDPLLVADGVLHLGLDPPVERLADALRNVGRGADEVLGQAEVVQRGLGLIRRDLAASGLEPLLDVADELLAGDVLFFLAPLERRAARAWLRAWAVAPAGAGTIGMPDRLAGCRGGWRGRRQAGAGGGTRARASRPGPAGPARDPGTRRGAGCLAPPCSPSAPGPPRRCRDRAGGPSGKTSGPWRWPPGPGLPAQVVQLGRQRGLSSPRATTPDSSTPPSVSSPAPFHSRAVRDMFDALQQKG